MPRSVLNSGHSGEMVGSRPGRDQHRRKYVLGRVRPPLACIRLAISLDAGRRARDRTLIPVEQSA